MLKLCIFDMDGTTVNTIDSIAYFGNRALVTFGLRAIETKKYKLFLGNGAKALVRRMIDETGGTQEQFDKVYKLYNESYDNNFLYLTRPYDGILKLLSDLRAMNAQNTILSNKPDATAKKISDALFGKELISVCIGGRETVALKPDPAGVFELIRYFGVRKNECLYIGDTATDIKTAKNAGLTSVGVLWGFRDRCELSGAGADYIVSYPDEILTIAKQF